MPNLIKNGSQSGKSESPTTEESWEISQASLMPGSDRMQESETKSDTKHYTNVNDDLLQTNDGLNEAQIDAYNLVLLCNNVHSEVKEASIVFDYCPSSYDDESSEDDTSDSKSPNLLSVFKKTCRH